MMYRIAAFTLLFGATLAHADVAPSTTQPAGIVSPLAPTTQPALVPTIPVPTVAAPTTAPSTAPTTQPAALGSAPDSRPPALIAAMAAAAATQPGARPTTDMARLDPRSGGSSRRERDSSAARAIAGAKPLPDTYLL